MNAYVAKEIRLLLPAYLVGLALAVVPVWLLPRGIVWTDAPLAGALVAVTLLSLSSFGREFSMATFPLLLAQPFPRQRIWRTKVCVLAIAVVTVMAAWMLSCGSRLPTQARGPETAEVLMGMILSSAALFAGGLWSTLLTRQVAAAFWFTVFVPPIIAALTWTLGGGVLVKPAICLYSVGGFVLARRLFFEAQEAMWTGGTVALSGWGQAGEGSAPSGRSHRPLPALFVKELQLQQISLMGMIGLLVLHFVVILSRKLTQQTAEGITRVVLDVYLFVWMFVPLVVGGLSIAEERRIGTMEAHLGLPVSRRIQFAIKFLFVLVLGGFLPLALLLSAEWVGTAIGAPAQIGIFDSGKTPIVLACVLLTGSLVSFYASSVTRNLLQSLGVSVVLCCLSYALFIGGPSMGQVSGMAAWQGSVFHLVAWPILIVAMLTLGYGNFRRLASDLSLWRRNAGWLAASLAAVALVTTVIYHRGWELVMPIEPDHGSARLDGAHMSATRLASREITLVACLPDGTLRLGALQLARVSGSPSRRVDRWAWVGGPNGLVVGTNWTDAAALDAAVAAIRSDGTLWLLRASTDGWSTFQQPPRVLRLGTETDWDRIVNAEGCAVWLLKRNGTLWRWGANPRERYDSDLGAHKPVRLGTDADWAAMMASDRMVYGWTKDGQAWALQEHMSTNRTREPEFVRERVAGLDNTTWLSLASSRDHEFGVRKDGTLWTWGSILTAPQRVGKETNWAKVSGRWNAAFALKTDGSLCRWGIRPRAGRYDLNSLFKGAPTRPSRHKDWVAIQEAPAGLVSLAADGGLWYWPEMILPEPFLATSRKPIHFANVFEKGMGGE